jgi:murein DD-endopeptidase MepM/ murein hydrolase activator NlpD
MKHFMVSIFCLAALWAMGGTGLAHGAAEDRESRAGRTALLAALWPERVAALAAAQGLEPTDWAASDRRAAWTAALFQAVGPGGVVREGPVGALPEAETVAAGPLDARLGALDGLLLGPSGGDAGAMADGDTCPVMHPGALSWPVQGRQVDGGVRKALPGLVMATAAGEPVRAAGDGRVVFAGVLRGLGRVVIVSHGPTCHTVYAFLARTDVTVGDPVTRETLLGAAGACPPAGGVGVYFELRFREKALNPTEWFAASP